jgi:tRNA pseudouridine55 synthase
MTQEQLLDGTVIVIDKPYQWTSFQVVNKIKSTIRHTYDLKKFKIGHAGTLDPLATGVLLVCVGKATKLIPQLQDGEKVYTGTIVFGATTPCYDMERAIDQTFPYEHITPALLDEKRKKFIGRIDQVPPMYSAVKIAGQRAYEYARIDDPTVTIQPKKVDILEFEITDFRKSKKNIDLISPINPTSSASNHLYKTPQCVVPEHLPQADFRIRCGKGTYIRSIARDLGHALGSGAFLSALRREQVGQYTIDKALNLNDIQNFFLNNSQTNNIITIPSPTHLHVNSESILIDGGLDA